MREAPHPFKNLSSKSEFLGVTQEQPAAGRIIACIGKEESFATDDLKRLKALRPTAVDFYGNRRTQDRLKQAAAGRQTYVISSVDSANKSSWEYIDCVGIAAVGSDTVGKQNISFLSHQWPARVLFDKKHQFEKDLRKALTEIKERCSDIDVVLFGGLYQPDYDGDDWPDRYDYVPTIELIRNAIQEVLGSDPCVITGPTGGASVVLDTQKRRLYVASFRDPDPSFNASDVKKKADEWER